MTDFSINNLPYNMKISADKKAETKVSYDEMKKVYESLKLKISRSDFANSVVAARMELETLSALKTLAEKENRSDEIQWISEKIESLNKQLGEEYKHNTNFSLASYFRAMNIRENLKNIQGSSYAVKKLSDAGIGYDFLTDIIKSVSYTDNDGNLSIDADTVNDIAALKNMFKNTRKNENNEAENPINKIGVSVLKMGKTVLMSSKNYDSFIDEDNISSIIQTYKEKVKNMEDGAILLLAKKYCGKDGKLAPEMLRTVVNLRRLGVGIDSVCPLTSFCMLPSGEINSKNIELVKSMKEAGVLSKDIIPIADSIRTEADGSYNPEDVQTAVSLTSSVLPGNSVKLLIPEIASDNEAKEFFVRMAIVFKSPEELQKILTLVKNESGEFDINAMQIVSNLADNYIFNTQKPMKNEEFTEIAENIVYDAMNPDNIWVSDDSAGICSVLCQNKETPENILQAFDLCKNEYGEYDESVASLIWKLALMKADISEITQFVRPCKNGRNAVNHSLVNTLISMLDAGEDKTKVLNYLVN